MTKKYRSEKEFFESEEYPSNMERVAFTIPGRGVVDVTKSSGIRNAKTDIAKVRELLSESNGKQGKFAHNHPYLYLGGYIAGPTAYPSPQDVINFVKRDYGTTTAIIQNDIDTRKIMGTTLLRKGKSFSPNKRPSKLLTYLGAMGASLGLPQLYLNYLSHLGLEYEFIPEEGFELSTRYGHYLPKKENKPVKPKDLETKLEVATIVTGILGSIFFLSSNFTGNVIANSTTQITSIIEIGLFAISLIAGCFWLRNRRNKLNFRINRRGVILKNE